MIIKLWVLLLHRNKFRAQKNSYSYQCSQFDRGFRGFPWFQYTGSRSKLFLGIRIAIHPIWLGIDGIWGIWKLLVIECKDTRLVTLRVSLNFLDIGEFKYWGITLNLLNLALWHWQQWWCLNRKISIKAVIGAVCTPSRDPYAKLGNLVWFPWFHGLRSMDSQALGSRSVALKCRRIAIMKASRSMESINWEHW